MARVLNLDTGQFTGEDDDTSAPAPTSNAILNLDTGQFGAEDSESKAALVDKLFNIETEDIRREEKSKLEATVNEDLNAFQQFTIGAGRGLTNIARGVGLVNQESEFIKESIEAQEGLSTEAGEVLGEAAPFLAAAPLAGAGLVTTGGRVLIPALESQAAKVLGSAALGAVEGAVITKGRGGGITETLAGGGVGGVIGGTAEAVFPMLGRLGGALFTSLGLKAKGPLLTPDGVPTPEFQGVLDKTNTSFDDLTQNALDIVERQGKANPEEVARAARLESQGIPATKGDVSQDFSQQAQEQRLLSITGDEASEPLRQLKLEQSQAFESATNQLIDDLGVPSETGDSLKAVLSGDKKLLTKEKNALYKEMADAAPEVQSIPILTDTIIDALPDDRTLRRLSRISGNQVPAVKSLLVEFGIDRSEKSVADFVESGGEVIQLDVGNFDEFRQAINQIERSDVTGSTKVVTGDLKRALDEEADLVESAIAKAGITDEAVLAPLKAARAKVRQLKTEFSPESIVGKLIDVSRRDGVTPIIEASKVAQKLLAKNAPIEHLQRTLKILRRSGNGGQAAIQDLQASVVMNALENALKASSRKIDGVPTIGGNQFAKSLTDFGEDKLKELFKSNPKDLDRLLALKQSALDITPAAAATPKGSAPVILDLMKNAARIPGIAAARDLVLFIVKAGADERAVKRALDSKPELKRVASVIEQSYPSLAVSLGIAGISEEEE